MARSDKEPHSTASESSPELDNDGVGTVQIIQLDPQVVRRDIGTFRIIALGFNIPNSWVTIVTSLSIALAAGGTVELIYGVIVTSVMYTCAAITLAELASVYPTAGGQYHFASILAPKRFNRSISYACGMISTVSWIIGSASGANITSAFIAAIAQFYNGYQPQAWHLFLMFQALNLFALVYNLFLLKRTNWIHDVAFVWTLACFITISIVCLVRGEKRDSTWVWTNFESNTGWTPTVSFLTGLSSSCYMFGGIDSALHLAEETVNAAATVPRALMTAIGIGFITAFVFAVVMAYCSTDLESLFNESIPIYKVWREAAKSDIAGTLFLVAVILIFAFILIAAQQTTSRLMWAMARDRGLLFSPTFAKLSSKLGEIPANALILNACLIFLGGCLSFASSAAFNALVGAFLLLQMISFAIPAALLMYQKRNKAVLPRKRAFAVPEAVGWFCNIGTIVSAVVQTVFFTFPTQLPVTGGNMNYAVVVLGIVGIFTGVNWFFYARKHYQGPRIELSL